VEFCANPYEGGTTPSYGAILAARERLQIALHLIIRPRGGDFLYSSAEFAAMPSDIEFCKRAGVDGVVLGLLLPDGSVDVERTRELVALAQPMNVTFHRAFDVTADPMRALEDVIDCGCIRLLTSGRLATAPEGAPLIRELVELARERIVVMPGSGVHQENLAALIAATGAVEFHASARMQAASGMQYRNPEVSFAPTGSGVDPLSHIEADPEHVRRLVAIARSCSR
jgi:copper homeostasis protein